MDKAYDHTLYEEQIYKKWEPYFAPKGATKGEKTFSIIMPPPNANDPLHVGHAMFVAIEDILTRYHRMKGEATLWLPGTDHAGIETQYVFEKKLAKEDKSRFDFDRESLFSQIWEYVQKNSDVAVGQMKKLGASADWSRFTFTLDKAVVSQVLETFIKLNSDGLIYRGERLVNYCTKCGTAYSELEVDYEERTDPMYYLKYGPFVIATARIETKFRDTALAANPKDERYKKYFGQSLDVMGLLGPIHMKVVEDDEVDPEFGTGIMKITPAHDPHDFELGKKYNLPVTPIIGFDGRMDFSWFLNDPDFEAKDEKYKMRAKLYHRMKVAEARKLMAQHLAEDGLIEKVDEKYTHRVGTCYRCKSVIEPLPLPQFFIKVETLAKNALVALDKQETKVLGAGREKILRDWLQNLRDWNISRQIVWGIRIPVWYDMHDNPELRVTFLNKGRKVSGTLEQLEGEFSIEEITSGLQVLQAPKNAMYIISIESPGPTFIQETDTFDTWFSSGQWPIVTLKTQRSNSNSQALNPNERNDFDRFYPTTVMETGYDILPFWVMRMMMLGIFMTGKSPFEYVYLHGLVRDEKGQKMSKSKGNVINPIDMVDKYGADAIRMALVMSSTPGQDKSVGETTIRGMRNLANKIWNASRYVITAMTNDLNTSSNQDTMTNDQLFKTKLDTVVNEVTRLLDELRVGQASEMVYNEFWHWYCDEVIEMAKRGEVSNEVLKTGLVTFLKLLHPFVPFVTEAVWGELRSQELVSSEEQLITAAWPQA